MATIKDRYAIVGVGESERSKNSGTTPLHLALDAARAALKDAGLEAREIDGFMSYSENDSCTSHQLATYLGVRPKYVKDIMGGGSSTEMLIADAIGLIETGQVNTVLIYRSMNGTVLAFEWAEVAGMSICYKVRWMAEAFLFRMELVDQGNGSVYLQRVICNKLD